MHTREELTEAALGYVFAHGLLNLSLRPLFTMAELAAAATAGPAAATPPGGARGRP